MKKLRNYFEKALSENQRQVIYACFPFVLFGYHSADLLINGEDQWFARLGSIIVAWALINLALQRQRYSNYLWSIERNRLLRNLNNQTQARDWMQDSLHLTFDIHASQIAQISHRLGQTNPFVEANDKAIQEFCQDIQKRMEEAEWHDKHIELIKESQQLEEDYHNEISKFEAWSRLFWRLEMILVIWGYASMGLWRSLCPILASNKNLTDQPAAV